MGGNSITGKGHGSAENISRSINLKRTLDLCLSSSIPVSVRTLTSQAILSPLDTIIFVDSTNGSFIVNLPQILNKIYTIKRINGGDNIIIIRPQPGEFIDGVNEVALNVQFVSLTIIYNGNWFII